MICLDCHFVFFMVSYVLSVYFLIFLFCFKQKTAYEMRISDWSSDVCSSDLLDADLDAINIGPNRLNLYAGWSGDALSLRLQSATLFEIGRASCRERVCQYV